MSFKKMSFDQAVSQLHQRIRPFVVTGDKARIVSVFSEVCAAACMQEGDEAMERMAGELREALLEPNRRVRRNIFPRL